MICGWRYKSDRGDGYISFKPRGYDGGWNHGINGDEILSTSTLMELSLTRALPVKK